MTHEELQKVLYWNRNGKIYSLKDSGQVDKFVALVFESEHEKLIESAPHLYTAVCVAHNALTEISNNANESVQKPIFDILKILETVMLASQQGTIKIGEQFLKENRNGR